MSSLERTPYDRLHGAHGLDREIRGWMGRNLPQGSHEIGGRNQETGRKKVVRCRHSRQEPQKEKSEIVKVASAHSQPASRGFARWILELARASCARDFVRLLSCLSRLSWFSPKNLAARKKCGGVRRELPRIGNTFWFACHAEPAAGSYFFSTLYSPFFQASSLKTRSSFLSPSAFSTLPLQLSQQKLTLAPPTVSSLLAS